MRVRVEIKFFRGFFFVELYYSTVRLVAREFQGNFRNVEPWVFVKHINECSRHTLFCHVKVRRRVTVPLQYILYAAG